MNWRDKIFFDPGDRDLAAMTARAEFDGEGWALREYASELHPRGILEVVEPRAFRIVRSVMTLLGTFTPGTDAANRRINALTLLRDELMEGLSGSLKYNTARVLPELAKELIRVRKDPERALRAAHDLRIALLGNPRFIRAQLKRFQLTEMPEDSLPVTFDYHVHDANTKGRKSPSHLIMDAWIKGIRKLQVIFYNQVPPEGAFELMRGAEIMGIDMRIGIEYRTVHRGRFVEMIWTPRGFSGADDFLKFLNKDKNEKFKARCEEAALYHTALIFGMLRRFNVAGRIRLNAFYKVELPSLSDSEFSAFLPPGRRPSVEHAAEFIEHRLRGLLAEELDSLTQAETADEETQKRIRSIESFLKNLTTGTIRGNYLAQEMRDEVPEDLTKLPGLMRLSPRELAQELRRQSRSFRLTLNLTNLTLADVVEILFECQGDITTLEIFNLKDHLRNLDRANPAINELRHALNSGNVVKLKSIILQAVDDVKASDSPYREEIVASLRRILRRLVEFTSFYARSPLGAAMGSDSAGKAALPGAGAGMGLAVLDTLEPAVQRKLRRDRSRLVLPVHTAVFRQVSFLPSRWFALKNERSEWQSDDLADAMDKNSGNLVSLGYRKNTLPRKSVFSFFRKAETAFHYLNSNLKIFLKVAVGFTAAFLTFFLSGSWWVLAWFGAPIWLGITLTRNVIQFRIASGTFRSAPLLKWNEFISWQRISDSLFYTGLSVPLLDFVVKNLIMRQTFGITTENNPLLLYSTMGLANGLYITSHNLLRALPAQAILGNWLRVPLAIPIAFTINACLAGVLSCFGLQGAEGILQQWASVISKFSSDCVGGVVESLADRTMYIKSRLADFKRKQSDLFRLISELELAAPETSVQRLLGGNTIFELSSVRDTDLTNRVFINALDLMYLWMRQPRAPQVIGKVLEKASYEERRLFSALQKQLAREKEINALLESRVLGRDSCRAQQFYQKAWKLYLAELDRLQLEKKRKIT